jgi:hypothetical protein
VGHTTLEYVYIQMAKRLAWASSAAPQFYPSPDTLPPAIALCEKIHPDATELSVAFGGLESWSWRYVRADCFYEIATSAGNPELCERVRPIDRPPPRGFLVGRNNPITPAACREAATSSGRTGWAEFGTEMLMLLIGYTRDQMTAAKGTPPEYGGAYEFLQTVLPTPTDDEDHVKRSADFLKRLTGLPDFSKGDDAARRQLDALAPGWSSPQNTSRLALALRCAVERRPPAKGLPNECLERMGP